MSSNRRALIGGPVCGMTIASRDSLFAWVQVFTGKARVARAYSEPAAGRLLYRLDGSGYLYAGDTHRACPGCEGVQEVGDGICAMCGTALTQTV